MRDVSKVSTAEPSEDRANHQHNNNTDDGDENRNEPDDSDEPMEPSLECNQVSLEEKSATSAAVTRNGVNGPLITEQQLDQQPQRFQSSSSPLETSTLTAPNPVKLIKSTRLKGYMTLTLAAFINLDSARTSSNIDPNAITIVPSTDRQRLYAQITAIISLIGTSICCLIHFDRITPLQNKVWIPIFFHTNGTSLYEGGLIIFYTLWWSIATGIATSVEGIAGDGKGQYSLYYSTWACCLTSFWLLERWFVASGWVRVLVLLSFSSEFGLEPATLNFSCFPSFYMR